MQLQTTNLSIPLPASKPVKPPSFESPACRFYFIPFSQDEVCLCGACFETGGISESKTLEEINSSLQKAQAGNYHGVIFPCYFVAHENASNILQRTQEMGLKVFVQISDIAWISEYRGTLKKLVTQGLMLNVLLGKPGSAESELLDFALTQTTYSYFTIVGSKLAGLPGYVAQLPQLVLNRLHFYFPLDVTETCRMFIVPDINQCLRKIVQKVRKSGKHLHVRGPKGVDIYEPHIPNDRVLEPELTPLIQSKVDSEERIEVSVVIPTFNSKDYIKNVLRHIFKQNLAADKFEVIVVDDGSDDGTQEELLGFVAPFQGLKNFKYLFFSRMTPRKRGDSQFRAGIARNAGVKVSSGRIFLFLDSDMLLPSHYLTDLVKKMETHDVIQGKRLFLNEDISNELTSYNLIDPEIDTYPEDPYWAGFQSCSDWNTLHNHWKYTCTHSLAVKADDFKRLGWFRKTFLYYGFEDVDLGYRLAQDGARFLLNDTTIYHLHPPPAQSEYNRSPARRQMILAKTCRIFFHHSLDDDAFQDFRGLLAPAESFTVDLPTINTRNTLFWFSHTLHMMRWRIMWFLFHPAPKAGVRLTGGLLRRTYWGLVWPVACWIFWRIKVIANWCYWRTYGLLGLFRWKVLSTIRWKMLAPLYYKFIIGTYNHVLIPAFWLGFKLLWPIRKPYHMVKYQIEKRIFRKTSTKLIEE